MASMRHDSVKIETKPKETMITNIPKKKEVIINRGAWTPEEDRKLSEVIAIHGAKRWKIIAAKAGLNRCGKSCRLRWLNYLRPNIKRGNISDQEEDLILRLHKLLGNRWSLIAGRLPGRTDNEIKNYWNSHLSKKINQKEKQSGISTREGSKDDEAKTAEKLSILEERASNKNNNYNNNYNYNYNYNNGDEDSSRNFNADDFFDFSNEDPLNLEWMSQFLEIDKSYTGMS